jgi:taurine transport system substrate-binding protein
MNRRHLLQLAALPASISIALLSLGAQAQEAVRIAYQTGADPAKVAQADGAYEKATGRTIDWRKFDSGADVITAIASGDIQIGYVGSSPLAAAASRELPIETIFIAAELGTAEALVVRNGSNITKGTDLVGKKIAVPFVSTTHYSLLAALKHWNVDPSKVTILNLRPPEISAAWQRGDIDGAYVWDPALGQIKASGKVLTSSAEVARWGAPTFDAWIVRKDFAQKYPDVVAQFVKVTGDAYAAYNKDPKAFASKTNVDKIAKLTGAKPEEIPELLAGNKYPTLPQQAALLAGSTVKAVAETSGFLKEQQKIDKVLPDYKPYVNARYVQAAASGTKVASAKP